MNMQCDFAYWSREKLLRMLVSKRCQETPQIKILHVKTEIYAVLDISKYKKGKRYLNIVAYSC